jgi:protein O-GlcNAc transferase
MSSPDPASNTTSCPDAQEVGHCLSLIAEKRFPEAANLIQGILARHPFYAFGWTMLGAVCRQAGLGENALACMLKAAELSPDNPDVHINLGEYLRAQGQHDEAEANLRHALRLKPGHAEALNELGVLYQSAGRPAEAASCFCQALQAEPHHAVALNNLGVSYRASGRLNEAENCYRQALQLDPGSPEMLCNLGNVLKDMGRLIDAEACYRQAIELNAAHADAHFNLGVALKEQGKLDDAKICYQQALMLKPGFPEAHGNLGALLMEAGKLAEAEACFRNALVTNPNSAELYSNLGNALRILSRPDEAVACYLTALGLNPDSIEARYNLCTALLDQGQLEAAIANYRLVLEANPNHAEAHNNLGLALSRMGRLEDAEISFRAALGIKPDFADGMTNLAGLLKDTGRIDEALDLDRRAILHDPHNASIRSNYLYTLYFHPDYNEAAILREAKAAWERGSITPSVAMRPCIPTGDTRLRIGYVSPDFRNHCQSHFTLPLLSNHDKTRFEIYCYAHLPRPDTISRQLEQHADQWRPTHLMTDSQLSKCIAKDGIDILVDLTMHMANGRPKVFAAKPAPIQVAWLAYPGTTGIPEMDYRITDPWLDPPGTGDAHYSETSFRLPDTFWCYDPMMPDLAPNPLPALAAGRVTFGCLNNFCKVTDGTLARWGRIMARVANSRLILLAPRGQARLRVLDILGRHGIAADRIEFAEFKPRHAYMQTYHRIDICLDTLPYNGHTTSLDALWMGVPVITQVGHTVVGRAGWSQLNNLGLADLSTFDEAGFIGLAVQLASDLPRLAQLRQTLRQRLEASPLMDGKRFARAMEAAFLKMQERHTGLK